MTLEKAGAAYDKENGEGSFAALSHERQMEVLTDAVKAERAKRK